MRTALVFFVICFGLAACSTLREDPVLEWSFIFNCKVPGLGSGEAFSSFWTGIVGLSNKNEWECERFTNVNGREVQSCLPSQLVTSPIQLERILTFDDSMWQWRDLVANGHLTGARANCTVSMIARNYTEIFEFTFYNAWPASWTIEPVGTMEVDMSHVSKHGGRLAGSAALMEKVTIVHEALGRSGQPIPILIRIGPGAKRDTPPPASVDETTLKNTIGGILGIDPARVTIVSQNLASDGYLEVIFTINNIQLGAGTFFDDEGETSGVENSAAALAVAFVDLRKVGDYDAGDITGDSTSPICVKVIPSGYSSDGVGSCNRPCTVGDVDFDHGETKTMYNRPDACIDVCNPVERTCFDGKVDGLEDYIYDYCSNICG